MEPYITVKWPGLLVKGEQVTKDQAAEIIIRTTNWPLNSNDEEIDKFFNEMIGPEKEFQKYINKINCLSLNYLGNKRITSCYIFGTHGWIDWDGNIFCDSYNIGKWPSLNEVTQDWKAIAEAFPFLKLKCQVIDSEITEEEKPVPTAQWDVCEGKVNLRSPDELLLSNFGSRNYQNAYESLINPTFPDVEKVRKGIELARGKYVARY